MATNTGKTPVTPIKTYVNGTKIEIVCRLCAKADRGSTNVLSKAGKEKKLLFVIESLLGIVVSAKDDLPKTVCRGCQKQLDNFMDFKNMCLQLQSTICCTVKRCKGPSPEPNTKRLLAQKITFHADHDKRVVIDVDDKSEEKFDEEMKAAEAQLVTKDLMVKAGLSAYDKNEVRYVIEIYSVKSIFSRHRLLTYELTFTHR